MSRRILVAEPSRTLSSLIKLTLRGITGEIVFANDGREALALAREHLPDLLICGAHLPGLDGYALTAGIRRVEGGQRLPVLLTVPDHTPADAERVAYLGIDDVLATPFERAALLERVRALLSKPTALAAPVEPRTPTPRPAPRQTPAPPQPPAALPPQPPPGARVAGPAVANAQAALASLDRAAVAALIRPEVSKQLEDRVEQAVEDAAARRLPALVEAAVERCIERTVGVAVADALPGLVVDLVEARLLPLLDERLPDAMGALADSHVRAAAEGAVSQAMPELMANAAFGLSPKIESMVAELLPAQLGGVTQKVVWKVVPEIAEDLIREEIRRLTEDGAQTEKHEEEVS
ncbi:MAG: hypothetical protein CSA24_02065 [Deltaproteobacteria bacterium]|nr:MAG: hypothetical protein CSA24_02065 [Deltaproteobacteria bacterium]